VMVDMAWNLFRFFGFIFHRGFGIGHELYYIARLSIHQFLQATLICVGISSNQAHYSAKNNFGCLWIHERTLFP